MFCGLYLSNFPPFFPVNFPQHLITLALYWIALLSSPFSCISYIFADVFFFFKPLFPTYINSICNPSYLFHLSVFITFLFLALEPGPLAPDASSSLTFLILFLRPCLRSTCPLIRSFIADSFLHSILIRFSYKMSYFKSPHPSRSLSLPSQPSRSTIFSLYLTPSPPHQLTCYFNSTALIATAPTSLPPGGSPAPRSHQFHVLQQST